MPYSRPMSDQDRLQDLLAKLREILEQLAMAQVEVVPGTLLASRIRHLAILAHYTYMGLEKVSESVGLPPASGDDELKRDSPGGS